VDSTLLFAMVTTKINKKAPLVFIPNRLKPNVRYDTRTEVDKVLAKIWVNNAPASLTALIFSA
jgi:chromosome partitioning protein